MLPAGRRLRRGGKRQPSNYTVAIWRLGGYFMPMITPLRWDDPEAVIDGLRHVTDPVQLALDTGHAIAVHTDETAANLIQGPAEASAMAEASIMYARLG